MFGLEKKRDKNRGRYCLYLAALLTGLSLGTGFMTKADTTKVIAHRGASMEAPENTLAAFTRAIELGADYFELDVRKSADDSLMIMHDASIDRTTNGTGNINTMSYDSLRQFDAGSWFHPDFSGALIPSLREALLLAKDSIRVCIELKTGNMVTEVVQLVEVLNMEADVIIFSYNPGELSQVKTLNAAIPTLYLSSLGTTTAIDEAVSVNADAFGPGVILSQSIVDYAHQQSLEIWKWTVNDTNEMKTLLDWGIDGIITDTPAVLLEMLKPPPPKPNVVIEPGKDEWISIVPNPNRGAFYFTLRSTEDPNASVRVIDIQGKVVYQSPSRVFTAQAAHFRIEHLETGIYLVQLYSGKTIHQTAKMMVY